MEQGEGRSRRRPFPVERDGSMEWFESLKADDVGQTARRWSRWDQLLALVLAATLLAALLFLFLPLLRQRRSMELQMRKLERQSQVSEAQARQLRREVDALQTDAAHIERVARDKLNLAAPGETLYQFDPPSQGGTANPH